LFEWSTSRVDAVDPTNFNNKSQSILPNFGVLVADPLAGKLSKLFVVLANDLGNWLVRKVVGALNKRRSLN